MKELLELISKDKTPLDNNNNSTNSKCPICKSNSVCMNMYGIHCKCCEFMWETMIQRDTDMKESDIYGKNITYCVKCQSNNISVNDKGYVCHNCGAKGTFEWYETVKD